MMVRHINAGVSDLDSVSRDLLESILALKDSLYLNDIDLK